MSIIKPIIISFLMFVSSNLIFSQKPNIDNIPFLVDLTDPLVAHYSVSKDTSSISISFYINGYESKQKREKAIKERNDILNKQKRREYIKLPIFSINFIDIGKPEKLSNLDCRYKTLNKLYVNSIPFQIYIIIKQSDGTYLKWSTVMLPKE